MIRFAILAIASPALAEPCYPLADMVAALDQSYHEREISRAVESRGGMVLTFASPAGTWTLVVVAPQEPLMACMVASGTGYMTIAPGVMN